MTLLRNLAYALWLLGNILILVNSPQALQNKYDDTPSEQLYSIIHSIISGLFAIKISAIFWTHAQTEASAARAFATYVISEAIFFAVLKTFTVVIELEAPGISQSTQDWVCSLAAVALLCAIVQTVRPDELTRSLWRSR
ncbi:hypothetical protein BJY04DRAFT_212603 [Aspergillus karnatakaensis]|uniref:uncharacterized protein n=1 Tax=Aspergillus karnatakaensis TaxID=1810916 RepID=UPI003CCD68F3